jgi:hypothetical protein
MWYNSYIILKKGDAMRLQISYSKNAASFYVVKSVYVNGKRTNKVYEKLGTYKELKAKLGDKDPYEWANEYVAELNRLEEVGKELNVTRERIRQIESKALRKLRMDRNLKELFNGSYPAQNTSSNPSPYSPSYSLKMKF